MCSTSWNHVIKTQLGSRSHAYENRERRSHFILQQLRSPVWLISDEHGIGFIFGGFPALPWIWIGFCEFCLTEFRMDLDLIILFWTSLQLSDLFWCCTFHLYVCFNGVCHIRRSCIPCRGEHWAWTGSGLDILQDTCDFFGSGLDLDTYVWKKLDQDICLISIRKFPWEWFKMSQMMVAVFSLLWLLY